MKKSFILILFITAITFSAIGFSSIHTSTKQEDISDTEYNDKLDIQYHDYNRSPLSLLQQLFR